MSNTQTAADVRDLASLVAEVIRRMGAAYGSPEDWRRDFTAAVRIMETGLGAEWRLTGPTRFAHICDKPWEDVNEKEE